MVPGRRQVPGSSLSFCTYGFACSVYFLSTESLWPLVSGFFPLAKCCQGSSTMRHALKLYFFLGQNTIPIVWTDHIVYLFISCWAFGWFPIWDYYEPCSCVTGFVGICFQVSQNTIATLYGNSTFYFFEEMPSHFPKSCNILHPHWQYRTGPTFLLAIFIYTYISHLYAIYYNIFI